MSIKTEPVITAAVIVGLLMAIVNWLIVMDFLAWTPDQITATEKLLAIAAPLALGIIGSIWARAQVTPLVKPKDTDGEPLTRADNSPALKARK